MEECEMCAEEFEDESSDLYINAPKGGGPPYDEHITLCPKCAQKVVEFIQRR